MTDQPFMPRTQPDIIVPVKTNSGKFSLLPWVVVVILLICLGYFGYQNLQLTQEKAVAAESPESSAPAQTTAPAQPTPTTNQWSVADLGGYSFEYPTGWHVASIWPNDVYKPEQGISIAVDPKPIDLAPRDGPLATVVINVVGGIKNPQEFAKKKIAEFNGPNHKNITTETINSPLGPIVHLKGELPGPMYDGEPDESYFFTIERGSDLINYQVIEVNMVLKSDPHLSEVLRHIALSFKKMP